MPEEVTLAMIYAAQIAHNHERWKGKSVIQQWQAAIKAALEAAPSGHGERG